MQELRLFIIIFYALGVLGLLIGYPAITNATATTLPSSSPQQESPEISDNIKDSALASLSQALQEDKEDGDQNGGENWERAINNLEDEMGFPVDEDVEEALMNITEVHLKNIPIQ
jgi:hypothetical protein